MLLTLGLHRIDGLQKCSPYTKVSTKKQYITYFSFMTLVLVDQFGLEYMVCDWEIYYRIVYMYTSAIGHMMDNYIRWQFMHVLCYIVWKTDHQLTRFDHSVMFFFIWYHHFIWIDILWHYIMPYYLICSCMVVINCASLTFNDTLLTF